jgi:integrase
MSSLEREKPVGKKIALRKSSSGGIKIQFQLKRHRYNLAPVYQGVWDNPADMARAQSVAQQIELDIQMDRFDASLVRYKPKVFEGRSPMNRVSKGEGVLDLLELWKLYSEHRKPMIASSTWKGEYAKISRGLAEMFANDVTDPKDVVRWLQANRTPHSTRRFIVQLNAACKWGFDQGFIKINPFTRTLRTLKVPKNKDKEDIDPFTADERDRIIETFYTEESLTPYAFLVNFLFITGCRPSEAIALEWRDVQSGVIYFNKTFTQFGLKKGLKTQEKRAIKQNPQLKELIKSIKESKSRRGSSKTNLLFPSPKSSNYIDWSNFSNKPWKRAFAHLPDITYRNPYQMRHTFITLALKNDVSIQDVARHCGNSPEIILRHYAGIDRTFVMPVF